MTGNLTITVSGKATLCDLSSGMTAGELVSDTGKARYTAFFGQPQF